VSTAKPFIVSLIAAGALAIGYYTFWTMGRDFDETAEAVASGILMVLLNLAVTGLCSWIAASREHQPQIRRSWLLIGVAALSNAIAECLWLYYTLAGLDPFPSLADVFYLAFYPLMLAGVLSLPYKPMQRERRMLIGLDMTIILAVCILFLWYFIVAPRQMEGPDGLAGVVALAYPIADLFILTGIISIIQRDLEDVGRLALIFLGASMLFTTAADVLFAYLETQGEDYIMPSANILWMVSFWSILVAGSWQKMYPTPIKAVAEFINPLLRTALLYVAPALGMGLAFASAVSLLDVNTRLYGTLLGSFILVALVLFRQYLVLHDNRKLYRKMELQAVTDALTGVYNRHHFNEAIDREIKRAERYDSPLTLLLLDVDNFKNYNDTFGHLRGDILLKQIAQELTTFIRSTDLLARFGGDEFVIILAETDIVNAQKVADKITSEINARFSRERVGMSIGMAVFQPGMNAQSLLADADRSLYHSKPQR